MPTDEQRKRFEEWEQTEAAAFLDDPDHCNYSLAEAVWLHAWLARDAEVQALRKELGQLIDAIAVETDTWTEADAENLQGRVQSARAALAGGETGETK